MNEAYAEDFFIASRIFLQCAGLWLPNSKHKLVLILYRIYSAGMFSLNLFFTATEFISLRYTYKNIHDLIKNICLGLTHLLGAMKIIFFYYRKDKFFEIIDTLESEEFHYDSCEEKDFFPGSTSKKYKKFGTVYTVVFWVIAHIALAFSFVPLALSALWAIYHNDDSHMVYILPYLSWMPFKYNTPKTLLLALSFQATPMYSYIYSIIGMDTLFMNILNLIACNLTVIQGAFITITNRVVKSVKGAVKTDSQEFKLTLNKEMRRISRHLQTIYRVCEDLEQIHKYLTLAQMTASLFILCSCLYLVSTTPLITNQFYTEILYMAAICFQLTSYCWFGNEVTLKAEEIPMSLWQCEWIETDSAFKKDMLITMTRAMKPLLLTVGNFAPLTLTTYIGIIKASYSFCAVIKSTGK